MEEHDSAGLIQVEEHQPEPPIAAAELQPEPAPLVPARKRGRPRKTDKDQHQPARYAKAGDDPLDRFIARRRAQAILALKLEGRKPREIATELNIPVKSVYWALYQLRRGGHLSARQEITDALDKAIKPLVVERLQERLESAYLSDELLVEAAKGTGIFVGHQKISGDGAVKQQQALIVKFELPPGASMPTTAIGEIHSAPLEAEVVAPSTEQRE